METSDIATFLVSNALENVSLHPVKLKIIWEKLAIPDDFEFIADLLEIDMEEVENTMIYSLINSPDFNWDMVIYPNVSKLTVRRKNTLKKRYFSFSNVSIKDFVWTKKTPGGVTLRHLTEAAYRMKINKYNGLEILDGVIEKRNRNRHLKLELSFIDDSSRLLI